MNNGILEYLISEPLVSRHLGQHKKEICNSLPTLQIHVDPERYFYLWGVMHTYPLEATVSRERLEHIIDESHALVTEISRESISITWEEIEQVGLTLNEQTVSTLLDRAKQRAEAEYAEIQELYPLSREIYTQVSCERIRQHLDWYSELPPEVQSYIGGAGKMFPSTWSLEQIQKLHPACSLFIVTGRQRQVDYSMGMDSKFTTLFGQRKPRATAYALETNADRVRLGHIKAIHEIIERIDHATIVDNLKELNIASLTLQPFTPRVDPQYFEGKMGDVGHDDDPSMAPSDDCIARTQYWINDTLPKIMDTIPFPFTMMVGLNHLRGPHQLLEWILQQQWRPFRLIDNKWYPVISRRICRI